MVSQSIRVNFIPSGVQDRLHASQYDTGERVFSFLCFYGSSLYEIPSGAVVTLNGQKPGGYTFVIPCTYDGSTVTCDCTASMTDVDGLVTCELEVVTNGEVVQSGNFYLVVEKAAIDSGAVPTSDFEAVSQMVADAAESAQAAEEAAASIDPSTFVQKSEITQSATQTTTGQKVVDAVELNKNVSGTLAKKISDNASAISALDTAVVKKVDLSTSGTVATQKQYAVDAWQLNPDNTGSYAAGVASEIASLENRIQAGFLALGNVEASSYLDTPITFPNAYSSAPNVVCSLYSASTSSKMGLVSISAINITTTGFTARVFNNDTAVRTPGISWVAIG